jgi:hypothetical protein
MTNSPEAVTLYVPLMKDLHMSWEDIKHTPRMELEGILAAYYEYNLLHSLDGYEAKDISDMAKHRPSMRQDWNKYMAQKRKYERLTAPHSGDVDSERRVEEAVSELKSKIRS